MSKGLSIELHCKFRKLSITLEEELRCTLINGFMRRGIEVYDCIGQSGQCRTPIMVDGIPMRPFVGDIPFVLDDVLRIIELKISVLKCSYFQDMKKYHPVIKRVG